MASSQLLVFNLFTKTKLYKRVSSFKWRTHQSLSYTTTLILHQNQIQKRLGTKKVKVVWKKQKS